MSVGLAVDAEEVAALEKAFLAAARAAEYCEFEDHRASTGMCLDAPRFRPITVQLVSAVMTLALLLHRLGKPEILQAVRERYPQETADLVVPSNNGLIIPGG